MKGRSNLSDAVKLATWPSPVSSLGDKAVRSHAGARKEAERKGWMNDLEVAAHSTLTAWATPAARDYRSDKGKKSNREQYGTKGMPLPRQALGVDLSVFRVPTAKSGVLNPEFPRWLMGFPEGWGKFAPTGTRLSRK